MRSVGKMFAALACTLAATAALAGDEAAGDAELDALFDTGAAKPAEKSITPDAGIGLRLKGYAELGGAYTVAEPEHWSKLRARLEVGASGQAAAGFKWKVSGRADGDAAYAVERDYYPSPVRDDQRSDFSLRETYIDFGAGDWEFRLGRQHVVWGEMVGFFFADVVSARDMREFFLPEFESLRIPQWAARGEYYAGDTHFELLWVPSPGFDDVGKPGADFFPWPMIPAGTHVHERKPSGSIENGNWGLRVSHLVNGWDLSALYYDSLDVSPTLYRVAGAGGMPGFELRHDRIRQAGVTMSKDLGQFVIKGEAVYTRGRSFLTDDPAAAYGLKASPATDYAFGVDIPLEDVWRFNVQYFGRVLHDRAPGMIEERSAQGMTFQVVRTLGNAFEFEFLAASSLNRRDYMLRPKLVWKIAPEWRAQFGADWFEGRPTGLLGRFDDRDRVYVEVRRWF